MLDGLLLVTGNGFGIIPLCVLMTRAKPTPEPGFENEVQDISRFQMRHAKINCPSIGFIQSRLCEKIF